MPRCEGCGKNFYRKYRPFVRYQFWDPPSYCPNCGTELSNEEKKDLVEHGDLIFSIACILMITIVIIVIIFS